MSKRQSGQVFDPMLVKAVKEYHLPQRDKHVELVRFVCDPTGDPVLLVRFLDEQNKPWSSLMNFWPTSRRNCIVYDVWETQPFDRNKETEFVNAYMAGTWSSDMIDEEDSHIDENDEDDWSDDEEEQGEYCE